MVSISTKQTPRAKTYGPLINDGFIICIHTNNAFVAAESLGFTNEVQLTPCQQYWYVNETFGRRLSRFAILQTGILGKKELVAQCEKRVYPDDLSFNIEANIWVTSIMSNQVMRVSQNGQQTIILQDYMNFNCLVFKEFANSNAKRSTIDIENRHTK